MEISSTRTIRNSNARSGLWNPTSPYLAKYKNTLKTLKVIISWKLLTALSLNGMVKPLFLTQRSLTIESFFGMEVGSPISLEFFHKVCVLHLQKHLNPAIILERVYILQIWSANLHHTVDLSSRTKLQLLSSVKLHLVTADNYSDLTMMLLICQMVSTARTLSGDSVQNLRRQSI